MNNVAIISPYFPPSSLAGVHRARHLAKHLPKFGWNPIIIRVSEGDYNESLDPLLASLVPKTVEELPVRAFSAGLAGLVGIGDVGLRGFCALRAELDRLVKIRKIDAVLITGSPFYPMLHARHIREDLGIPVVLDFQDPWVSVDAERRPRWSKGWAAHKLAVALEPVATRHADFITSVSDRQNEEMAARYSFVDLTRMAAIPIGGDPDDYKALQSTDCPSSVSAASQRKVQSRLSVRYVGTLWPAAIPVLNTFLESVAELRERRPDIYRQLEVNFIGTTRNPHSSDGSWVSHEADRLEISDVIDSYENRLPYLEALQLQAQADVILLLGSNEPHYTASKIYGVLMSGRPFLAIFHRESSSHRILKESGGGSVIGFDSESDLVSAKDKIASALVSLLEDPSSVGEANPEVYAPYTSQAVTGRFAEVLTRVTRQTEESAE